ncbi:hypothetical protein EIK77_000035 [Talaromyces pinophilus]|nr:hypothetical protein EIK77_000035 [Talaromyces pinophilus]
MDSSLQWRDEGVRFKGERSAKTYIEHTVTIQPGAIIDLSKDVQISGDSIIGGRAIIEGGRIQSSRIYGRVFGGSLDNTFVDVFATISGGLLTHSSIRDDSQVNNGTLYNTTLRNNAKFNGGHAIGSEISDNSQVTGGWLRDSIVADHARITGGQVHESRVSDNSQITGGLIERSVIQGDVAVNEGTYLDQRIGNVMSLAVLSKEIRLPPAFRLPQHPSHCHPPAEIIDKSTGQLFHDPVCTINGETQSRSGRNQQGGHKLYTNFAVQDIIQRWEQFKAASKLMQTKGYSGGMSFSLPSFIDPITSQPIKTAVLCSCGTTFDRESIQRWFFHYHSCPVSGHPFPEDGVYPNMLIQRLIERASSRSVV